MIQILQCLTFSQMSLILSSEFLSFFFSLLLQLFLPFYSPAHLSVLPKLLHCWFTPEYFFIWIIMLFIVDYLCFNSSRYLLNISYTILIHASCLFIHASVLFSRFCIDYNIIVLNSFSGRLFISSSFVWSGGFSPCSFTFCTFLCLCILLSLLCLESPCCKLESCSLS